MLLRGCHLIILEETEEKNNFLRQKYPCLFVNITHKSKVFMFNILPQWIVCTLEYTEIHPNSAKNSKYIWKQSSPMCSWNITLVKINLCTESRKLTIWFASLWHKERKITHFLVNVLSVPQSSCAFTVAGFSSDWSVSTGDSHWSCLEWRHCSVSGAHGFYLFILFISFPNRSLGRG